MLYRDHTALKAPDSTIELGAVYERFAATPGVHEIPADVVVLDTERVGDLVREHDVVLNRAYLAPAPELPCRRAAGHVVTTRARPAVPPVDLHGSVVARDRLELVTEQVRCIFDGVPPILGPLL